MRLPATKLQQINIESGKRLLVTSDVHGHLSYLQYVLKKASFSDDDVLIIVGDMIEKGPDSLSTLRYIIELCAKGNAIPIIGNVDAYRLAIIDRLDSSSADEFYNYLLRMRDWYGTSFYDELATECGYTISSPDDILSSKNDIICHFEKELCFLADLPTIVETQKFVFVHGGLIEKNPSDNKDKGLFELTKFDSFMTKTNHIFDKITVVGHWPVSLYSDTIQQLNPVINKEKNIISIDGGCGLKDEAQLNLLIIPDIECDIDCISHISYDEFPIIRAITSQSEVSDSVHIYWLTRDITLLERGEEFSYIEHKYSGKRLYIPNSYLINDSQCHDYTNYVLPIQKGDKLKLINKNSKGCIVKKNGVVGWYYGEYEYIK